MARRCGNPRCRCASNDAHKHSSLYLGQTRASKTSMQYVPRDQEQTVRRWVENFQQASSLLEALSQQGWRRLGEAKAKAKAAKKRAPSKRAAKKAAKKTPRSKTRPTKKNRKPPSGSS